jgi:hypothetical protein
MTMTSIVIELRACVVTSLKSTSLSPHNDFRAGRNNIRSTSRWIGTVYIEETSSWHAKEAIESRAKISNSNIGAAQKATSSVDTAAYGEYINFDDSKRACPMGFGVPTEAELKKLCFNTTNAKAISTIKVVEVYTTTVNTKIFSLLRLSPTVNKRIPRP